MNYTVSLADGKGGTALISLPGTFRIRPHFALSELANTKTSEKVQFCYNAEVASFLDMIEEFRRWFNLPMTVNSCFRAPKFNASVGGDAKSLHLQARALDWGIRGHTEQQRKNVTEKWRELCLKYGKVGGINYYDWGYHLDDHEDYFSHHTFQVRDYR